MKKILFIKNDFFPQVYLKIFVMMIFIMGISSTAFSNEQSIKINLKDASFEEVLLIIKERTPYNVMCDSKLLSHIPKVTIKEAEINVQDLMDKCLRNTNISYKISNNTFILFEKSVKGQNDKIKIKGRIVDEKGEPIVGATIILSNEKGVGAVSQINGDFEFLASKSALTKCNLIVSFIGYQTQKIKIDETLNEYNVILKISSAELKGVVITGMYKRKEEGYTGSAIKVSGDEILKLTSGNVLKAIQMLDPGFKINVSNVSGSDPNAIPDLSMRGQSNIGDYSTSDKVILRGDLQSRPNQPLFVLDGIIGVDIQTIVDIDPNQISSITLLKDAAAMVIYGSRASNGVIVVETKSPERGKLRVSYNGNYQVQVPDLSVYNLLDAKGKLEFEEASGLYQDYYTADNTRKIHERHKRRILEVERGVNSYWLKEPVRTAFSQRHGIDLEGGDLALRYKIHFGFNSNPGVMKGTDVVGKSGSINIRYRTDKISISNILYVDQSNSNRVSPYGSYSQYATINPYFYNRDSKGRIRKYFVNDRENYDIKTNPTFDTQYNQENRNYQLTIRNAFSLEYKPIKNLRFSLDANFTNRTNEVNVFKPGVLTEFVNKPLTQRGIYNWDYSKSNGYNVSLSGNYNALINEDHLLSVFSRFDVSEDIFNLKNIRMSGFPNENMNELFLGTTPEKPNGSESTKRSIGFLTAFNYSYKHKYALDFNIRMDASSEFGRNNRFAPFWSAGIRWNMYKEEWIENLNFFSDLNLRLTYGQTGSQGFQPYQSMQIYTSEGLTSNLYDSSDVIGSLLKAIGNPDLKWQKTDQWNFGFDFSLWKNIIRGRIEYYYKYTKNTLLPLSLPPSVGFSTITDNLGNISNKGMELTLRIMPYMNIEKGISFNIVATASQNKNKIENISNALKIQNDIYKNKTTNKPLPRYEPGYSQTMIWGVQSLGINPVTGKEIFLKKDGKTRTGIWDYNDMVPLGDAAPKLQGALTMNFMYKNWTLTVAGSYKFGGYAFNQTVIDKVENANANNNVDRRALISRWKKPGDISMFTKIHDIYKDGSKIATRASSRFLMKDNELYINSINLSYWFSNPNKGFMKRLGLSSASVSLYVNDIARFSTIEMERGIDYPFSRSVSMSLNLIF